MKRIIAVVLSIGLLSGGSAFAKKVTFNELPQAVQKTIIEHKSGNEKAITIKEETEKGQMVYQVSMKREGGNANLWISTDGSLVKSTGLEEKARKSAAYTEPKSEADSAKSDLKAVLGKGEALSLGDAPVAVQDAVKAEFGTAENIEVRRDTKDGLTVYNVELKQEGKNQKLTVAEDGSILKNNQRTESAIVDEKAGAEYTGGKTEASPQRNLALTDTPQAVQDTIMAQKGEEKVEEIKINKRTKDGTTYYEVKFKKEGKNMELHIAEDGKIMPGK